ncbi:MAG: hypothetical protein VX550_06105 [Bacteroidota bacterium]|nr:hypothetical protein [Bacteroidota bacterium]
MNKVKHKTQIKHKESFGKKFLEFLSYSEEYSSEEDRNMIVICLVFSISALLLIGASAFIFQSNLVDGKMNQYFESSNQVNVQSNALIDEDLNSNKDQNINTAEFFENSE